MKLGVPCLAVAFLAGCGKAPVDWSDPEPTTSPDAAARLVVDDAGAARWRSDAAPQLPPPATARACPGSLRWAREGRTVYAVWWVVRSDSSARLVTAASPDDGATWHPIIPVDTADISVRGCDRPAPSIAATGPDVHVAYAMRSAEGTGVFLAHSMDRGAMFHSPIPVAYGERLVATDIAAAGDVVVVAYEDPSSTVATVELALSRTQGHVIDAHTPASRDVDQARSPSVAIAGRRVAVAWRTGESRPDEATVVRVGTMEP